MTVTRARSEEGFLVFRRLRRLSRGPNPAPAGGFAACRGAPTPVPRGRGGFSRRVATGEVEQVFVLWVLRRRPQAVSRHGNCPTPLVASPTSVQADQGVHPWQVSTATRR